MKAAVYSSIFFVLLWHFLFIFELVQVNPSYEVGKAILFFTGLLCVAFALRAISLSLDIVRGPLGSTYSNGTFFYSRR